MDTPFGIPSFAWLGEVPRDESFSQTEALLHARLTRTPQARPDSTRQPTDIDTPFGIPSVAWMGEVPRD